MPECIDIHWKKESVVKYICLEYNIFRVDSKSQPGMCDNPVILNLHLFKRDSYISVICQASIMQWTTKKQMRLPTWLRLGLKIQGPAFWGFTKDKRRSSCTAAFCTEKVKRIFSYMSKKEKMKKAGNLS